MSEKRSVVSFLLFFVAARRCVGRVESKDVRPAASGMRSEWPPAIDPSRIPSQLGVGAAARGGGGGWRGGAGRCRSGVQSRLSADDVVDETMRLEGQRKRRPKDAGRRSSRPPPAATLKESTRFIKH